MVSGPGSSDREVLAESDDHFFVRDDGTPIEVSSDNGSTVLKIDGAARAVKTAPQPN
jgi:hypothetical protein